MPSIKNPRNRHLLLITITFAAWKALLVLVAYSSPGIGYDTSSSLLESFDFSPELTETPSTLQHSISKFVRWDAIYFTQIATRQYVFEQEWAFSFAFARIVSTLARVLPSSIIETDLHATQLSGSIISHSAHLGSAYILYLLTRGIYGGSVHGKSVALCATLLHILSPAGIFLSATYAESLFSLVNISGFALYIRGMNRLHGHASISQRLQVIAAGFMFGTATLFRSNGLLSGLPFLYDAVARSWAIANHGFSSRRLYDLGALILGGVMVAFGILIPQIVAYRMYCIDSAVSGRQPWCERTVPSIYAWVQEHYWVNGLFRYWTVSNLPLFLLAVPMLCILGYSAFSALWPSGPEQRTLPGEEANVKASEPDESALVRLALPQLLLAVLALFVYNVQIITRLSSGYPLWYIWLANRLVGSSESSQNKASVKASHIFRFMVMYAVIQGGLFASFLPPA